MEKKELKQILAGVSLAALLAGAATGCAGAGKCSCSGGKSGCSGKKSDTTTPAQPPQGGGMSGCGGASGCGGMKK